MKNNEILTIREVADYLRLTEKTAYRLAAEGEIPGFKIGGSWRFNRNDIASWTRAQTGSKNKKANRA